MTGKSIDDPFTVIRTAHTAGPNYGLDTDAIIARLTRWRSLCSFMVTGAEGDTVYVQFDTLPADMDAFVKDLFEFCPDLVYQGTGCADELIGHMADKPEELTPELRKLIEGVDFSDEDYGLEILKRELMQNKKLTLWWD